MLVKFSGQHKQALRKSQQSPYPKVNRPMLQILLKIKRLSHIKQAILHDYYFTHIILIVLSQERVAEEIV